MHGSEFLPKLYRLRDTYTLLGVIKNYSEDFIWTPHYQRS